MKIIRAFYFQDEKHYLLNLPRGNYIINGNPVGVDCGSGEITVSEKPVITTFTITNIHSHYEDKDGNKLSLEEREKELSALKSKGDFNYDFDDIEDSFALQRFKKRWRPVFRAVRSESDVIPVEIVNTKFDTGNKYITNLYTLGDNDPCIFVYNRVDALLDIARKVMQELGMVYESNITYKSTKGKKIWGNSHEGIRFLFAFGTYVFDNKWQVNDNYRGPLSQMKAAYEEDKNNITRIIKSKYAEHFNVDANIDLTNLLNDLRQISALAVDVDSKSKTMGTYRHLMNKIAGTIKNVETQLSSQA